MTLQNNIDLTDLKCGKWLVLKLDNRKHSRQKWLCQCECGTIKAVSASNLIAKYSTSCGCNRNGHGNSNKPEFRVWINMISRCTDKNNIGYKNYGADGIKVCKEWLESFETFYSDMGACPEGMQLDRIDNDDDYKPTNCRWSTRKANCRNKRNNRLITHNEETKTLIEWGEVSGIKSHTISERLSRGWPIDKALSQPIMKFGVRKQ